MITKEVGDVVGIAKENSCDLGQCKDVVRFSDLGGGGCEAESGCELYRWEVVLD